MRGPHNILRLIRTGATLERTGAMPVILNALDAPKTLTFAARLVVWPFQFLGRKGDQSLPPAPRALTAMGPAYIKFGQILSTRPDVVGQELADQLRVLQDKLPPFSTKVAKQSFKAEIGLDADDVFSDFSEPVAAASIAQVHRGQLKDTGHSVAIKVLRPEIERAFQRDLDTFYFAARLVEFVSPKSRRLKPMDVIAHFDGVVRGELDLRLESASASESKSIPINEEFGIFSNIARECPPIPNVASTNTPLFNPSNEVITSVNKTGICTLNFPVTIKLTDPLFFTQYEYNFTTGMLAEQAIFVSFSYDFSFL